jgi:BlaI family transcriptional regulator, penicillinase repressor
MAPLPDLSRFELQCLGALWSLRNASIRDVHNALDDPPSYSTVKKIFERLEEKGAVARVRRDGKAWVYRSAVRPRAMIRKEIRRLLESLFDGQAAPLVAHLADMDELSVEDLKEIERTLKEPRHRPVGRRS